MRLRNPLFAPADQPRKVEKALASAADAVILDLEDSVAPSGKDAARAAVVATLRDVANAAGRGRLIVRVNAGDTPWYLADVAAVVAAGPAALLLPKCGGPADLARLSHQLDVLETAAGIALGATQLIALPAETVGGALALDYAGVTPRLAALCFGAEDLSADLGGRPRGADGGYAAPVAATRAALLLAAAHAGVAALDTPWPDPRDGGGLAREAAAAARDGFAGKLCIHPAQIAPVADAFTPDAERIAWARAVRAALAAQPDAGVLALDGRMIDRPHLKLAERALAAIGE